MLLCQRKPKAVVEIGTKFGGTLAMWCAVADPEATIVSIDLPGGIHGGGHAYWRTIITRMFLFSSILAEFDLTRPDLMDERVAQSVHGTIPQPWQSCSITVPQTVESHADCVCFGQQAVLQDLLPDQPEILLLIGDGQRHGGARTIGGDRHGRIGPGAERTVRRLNLESAC